MSRLSRRGFLKTTGCAACVAATGVCRAGDVSRKEVPFYEHLDGLQIECAICPRQCRVGDGERGYCGNKENRGGRYESIVYGRHASSPDAVDPIEKMPLYHYSPGSRVHPIATAGCNVECKYCQNWQIAQSRPEQVKHHRRSPSQVVDDAVRLDCDAVAFTFTEPVVFYSYMFDIAVAARSRGLGAVMISNGYINAEPMKALCEHLSAVKIDLKGFSEKFYGDIVNCSLKPVLDTLKTVKAAGVHLEIVNLVLPGLNDAKEDVEKMCKWIHDELGPDVPLHFTRFHKMYKLKYVPDTPMSAVERARDIGLDAGLRYVYLGNTVGHPGESTYCSKCGKALVRRAGFKIVENCVGKSGSCPECSANVPGIWSKTGRIEEKPANASG
ncbi:AmmeMemoRadiSam system radical SAM enzyme [Candidatus Hydrogenedentota bacterium]